MTLNVVQFKTTFCLFKFCGFSFDVKNVLFKTGYEVTDSLERQRERERERENSIIFHPYITLNVYQFKTYAAFLLMLKIYLSNSKNI
jgi:hypothetical protein